MARQFYRDAGRAYGKEEEWLFEPHVAEEIMNRMVAAARGPVRFCQYLDRVAMQGKRIVAVTMRGGLQVEAGFFIDVFRRNSTSSRTRLPADFTRLTPTTTARSPAISSARTTTGPRAITSRVNASSSGMYSINSASTGISPTRPTFPNAVGGRTHAGVYRRMSFWIPATGRTNSTFAKRGAWSAITCSPNTIAG